ncbi:MAG TPA: hypothetical protein PLO37_08390 [Candidatus Hydrogenedentes bacterium]|nr:hypothetical protein [Candidatus Hydrogenedentota bacterium]HPG66850.1 hypothetical protein [Candidatus Hydrogenedentota bacterium]
MMMALIITVLGATPFEFTDAFDYVAGSEGEPAWFADSVAWEARDGTMRFGQGARSFLTLEQSPFAAALEFEATVTVVERRGTSWAVAGICVRLDPDNYWHIALVEAPEEKGFRHTVELCEALDGRWLAQQEAETRLTELSSEGYDFNWKCNTPYRLKLVLTRERIEGHIFEADGTQRAHLARAFDHRAVTSGRPALDAGDLQAVFDNVRVHISEEAPAPVAEVPSRPPYAVPAWTEYSAEATGFFYTKNRDDGQWWLIDPLGRGFYIVGTDHIRYEGHGCQALGYAPYGENMKKKYGSEEAWAEATAARLAEWGFNTLPAGHSPSLRYRSFAHIEFLSLGSSFSSIDDLCPKTTWTGFPNVFSPKWARHCDKVACFSCAPLKDDPWLIGYFLDNELEWFGKNYRPWGLFDEAWKKPATHGAKQAWIAFLKEKLPSPDEFAQLWGVAVHSWEALAEHTEPTEPGGERAEAVAREWVRRIADAYFRTTAEAIRRHDPNHLVLGSRFAGTAPDVWDVCGTYCDVVSFNMYPRIDVETGVPVSVIEQIMAWQEASGKPMMITEWSFPALDSGLPCKHGAGMRVATQAQRAKCFTHFQSAMFSLPFMVGSNYFMFVDEPALGIADTFPEDSNYGLVNERDEPYPELVEAAARLNAQVYALHHAGDVRIAKKRRIASWLRELPNVEPTLSEEGIGVRLGQAQVEGPAGHRAWQMRMGETLLGYVAPMIHQRVPDDLWVFPDTVTVTEIRVGADVRVVDMRIGLWEGADVMPPVDENSGASSDRTHAPCRYDSQWRFWLPKRSSGWFAGECLWIKNLDVRPWRLMEIFHFIMPAIGGSSEQDEPFSADVPNYYLSGEAWVDTTEDRGIGCWFPDGDLFDANFWKDPGGGFHGDLRQKVDVELRPGELYEVNGPPAFYFPLDTASALGFTAMIDRVAREALAEE